MNHHNMNRTLFARYKIIYFGAFLLMLTLAACGSRISQQPDEAHVTITLTAESTEAGQTALLITVKDDADKPIDDATLKVKGEMTHAGMSPVLAEVIGADKDGVYRITYHDLY